MAQQSEIVSVISKLLEETTHEERYQVLKGFASKGDGRSDMLSALLRGNRIKDNYALLQHSGLSATDVGRLMKACTEFVTAPLYEEEVKAGIHGGRQPGTIARMPGIAAWIRRVRRANRK